MAGLYFISLLWNNLRRHPFRHGTLAACVAAAVSLPAAVGLLSGGPGSRIELSLARLGADLIAVPDEGPGDSEGAYPAAWTHMDRKVEDKIAAFDFVAQTSPQTRIQTPAGDADGSARKFSLIGFEPETDFTVRPWLKDNRERRLGPDEALAGGGLGLKTGDHLKLSGHPYRVVGVLEPSGTGLDSTIFIPLESASRMTREDPNPAQPALALPPDQISAVMIRLKPEGRGGRSPRKAAEELEKGLYEATIIIPEQLLTRVLQNQGAIFSALRPAAYAGWASATLIMGLVFAMAAAERRRELGLLRAMGATRGFIFRLIFLEALTLAGAGAALGLMVSTGLGLGFSRLLAPRLAVDLEPQASGERSGLWLCVFLMALLTTALAAAYPAIRFSRMDPDEAIRKGE